MASTPGYEETDHTACKQEIAALETKLRDSQVTIAEKDRVIKDREAKIKSLLKDGNGTGPKNSWIGDVIDRGGALLKMLDQKTIAPTVEHAISILAGALIGTSMS